MGQFDDPISLVQTVSDVAALDLPDDAPVAYITQTNAQRRRYTAVIQALHNRFENVRAQTSIDICYATQNRQAAVRDLSKLADVILVVGRQEQFQLKSLREIGEEAGIPSYLWRTSRTRSEWVRGRGERWD